MFKAGDKVNLKGRREVVGTVSRENMGWLLVNYDDPKWIPRCDWHKEADLELYEGAPEQLEFNFNKQAAVSTCSCGAKYSEFPDIHLSFCDLFEKYL